ncbi:MAG: hypothetical protein HN348_02495 [Proteobacteria bacterium]|jgi:thymidylate kinase|nr:hypothetical protein [Pseudomonadota bacterium]
MNYRHVILEGKPTTGKTEVSELFKIYFPSKVKILPELTTILVRQNQLNILRDRKQLNDLLAEAVPARAAAVKALLEDPGVLVFEESHMGVHWAYSKILDDQYFLDLYEEKIKQSMLFPDIFMRLDIPIALSVQRQVARATKDVEVSGDIVRNMFKQLNAWHQNHGRDNLVVVNTNRSPAIVIGDIMKILGLTYQVFKGKR